MTRQKIVLWPIPSLEEPPFHTLPHDQLLAGLKGMTNYRLRRDPRSSSGWELAWDEFPGWEPASDRPGSE